MKSTTYVNLLDADEGKLLEISEEGQLALNLDEMKAIKDNCVKMGRNPSDIELETFAQTWSEHCLHKTFRGDIKIGDEKIENLLKSTVARVTEELNLSWCFSVFEDNAGIVDFEGDTAIAFKVETHNHPSALEPFGGAATGVGGVIRDVLGVWGEPIANTNVLCFGPLDLPYEQVPPGTKHPRFIYSYVVAGIGTYGNNMGIPTVNGAIFFDESYTTNPLVYCGTVGLVPKSRYVKDVSHGDIALLVGGKTGRDGVHGVTFASLELNEKSEDTSTTSVQIGDPILEEKIKRGVLQLRDESLGSAITDLGGGGLSSAIGEMAHSSKCGVKVFLERVPLKYPNMAPWEIWISESQERMLIAIPQRNLERAREIFEDEDVEATPIGEFTDNGRLKIEFNGEVVADMDLDFLFGDVSKVEREVRWSKPEFPEPDFKISEDLTPDLLAILSSPNVASKESVIRTYDHEVKAMSVIKPLQGVGGDSPGDAAVMKPLFDSWKGVVISNGLNPEYGKIDPYHMAASAIDEAVRNNVAMGGRRISILDNFCWGNPEKPENLAGLVRAAQACYDIAKEFGTPFISGKDSLYNESPSGPVTPTLLISALGIIPDVRKAVTMDIKEPDSAIYIIGITHDELGGSHYYKVHDFLGNNVPKVNAKTAKVAMAALTNSMDQGIVKACHDLSEGGLGVAAAEMAFGGDIGIELDLDAVPLSTGMRPDHVLFSESNSRFLVEVNESDTAEFEDILKSSVFAKIGTTTREKELKINSRGRTVVSTDLASLKQAWQGTLK
jgi:phosphoribosylformylglycinamidine synthase